jgi:catechol 2,3-dioxygenase-like lactoylglutathione lyase family enzyme
MPKRCWKVLDMTIRAKYVHTNRIVRDWEKRVGFYKNAFGCTPASPESIQSGQWVETITGVPDAGIRAIHLRLPGHGDKGPTLEVIRCNRQQDRPAAAANRPGFGHIAFAVDDVKAARDAALVAGAGRVGDGVSVDIPGRGRLSEIYVGDPEGNIIELQKWSP